MLKKLNKKGFTLVELLATIALLAIIGAISFVSITAFYEKSKEKSNEAFKKQIKTYVDDYISLYSSTLKFSTTGDKKNKCYQESEGVDVCDEVMVYPVNSVVTINTIIDSVVNDSSLMNPSTEIECTNDNTSIEIYRDTDFVYCFNIIPKSGTENCINETLSTCGFYK